MMKIYSFYKICEMNTMILVNEVIAYDLNDAMRQNYEDYDIMAVNGELI